MTHMRGADDFFEEDEPVEKIFAAFEKAEKGQTKRPSNGVTEYLIIVGLPIAGKSESESGTTVNLAAA
jgi:hypothetical protein